MCGGGVRTRRKVLALPLSLQCKKGNLMENLSKIETILHEQAKTLMGVCLKRFENLELPKEQVLTHTQIKCLYSNIIKDTIFENNRVTIKLIRTQMSVGDKLITRGSSQVG